MSNRGLDRGGKQHHQTPPRLAAAGEPSLRPGRHAPRDEALLIVAVWTGSAFASVVVCRRAEAPWAFFLFYFVIFLV
ncbi:hypothetical protein MHYP_G00087490 [Metynnis hypsauchen]